MIFLKILLSAIVGGTGGYFIGTVVEPVWLAVLFAFVWGWVSSVALHHILS